MKAGKGIRTFSGWRRIKRGRVFLLALLLGSSCGNETGQEDRDITPENSGENRTEENSVLSSDSEDNTNEMIAVADFYYLPLSSLRKDFALSSEYTISDQWMSMPDEWGGQQPRTGDQIKKAAKTGISFGSALAMVISYANWHSVGWAIVHGLLSWVYVIYFILRY